MHHTDQTGRPSTWGILADRANGSSDRGATAAHPATRTPGATLRPHSILTYSPRARPVSARLVFESSRWLRHQHTEEPGFLGPSMVATSPNRAFVAGRTTMLTVPGYARPPPRKRSRPHHAIPGARGPAALTFALGEAAQ